MHDEEFLGKIGGLYEQLISLEKDENYVVNPPQMKKFVDLVSFLQDKVSKQDGEMDRIELSPKRMVGDVTVYFYDISVRGAEVQKICDLLRECSVFGIDALKDGKVCISCTIPDVFIHK